MSKSQSSFLKSRGCYLCIAAAILLMFSVFFAFRTPPQQQALLKIKVVPSSAVVPRVAESLASPVFDAEVYYRPIIDNNLFRPLGWTPARPKEPYHLLGTILARDANTLPKAILQTTAGDRTYIVSTGDKIDALTEVVSIEAKQVKLETEGQLRTLKFTTTHWLTPSRATRFVSQRQTPVRPPQGVRRTPTPTPAPIPALSSSLSPPSPDRAFLLSGWQTREGIPIPIGDARLKNPAKWRLRRR